MKKYFKALWRICTQSKWVLVCITHPTEGSADLKILAKRCNTFDFFLVGNELNEISFEFKEQEDALKEAESIINEGYN